MSVYVKEAIDRCQFLQGWVDNSQPKLFWLPGFFFTQVFLTRSKQNFARIYTAEIDKVDFDFIVKDDMEESQRMPQMAESWLTGCSSRAMPGTRSSTP